MVAASSIRIKVDLYKIFMFILPLFEKVMGSLKNDCFRVQNNRNNDASGNQQYEYG